MNVDWFLGFCEGEGNFVICFFTKNVGDKHYVYARPAFQIQQSELPVQESIHKFLCEQNILTHLHKISPGHRHNFTTPGSILDSWILQAFETNSLNRLVVLLEPLKWESHKRVDFEKWVQCIKILSNKNKSPYMVTELRLIAQIAFTMNGYQGRRVWTPEYLEAHLRTYKPYKDIYKTQT